VTQDPEKSPTVQFPGAVVVPTYDAVFNVSLDRHSPSEGHPSVMQYDQTSVGSVNSIRRPVPARVPSDTSSDPQGLKRSGSNGSGHSADSSTSAARTYAVAGSHHAIMAAHQHQNSTSSSNNAKRGWVIE